jgi:hypothetical protein
MGTNKGIPIARTSVENIIRLLNDGYRFFSDNYKTTREYNRGRLMRVEADKLKRRLQKWESLQAK